MILLRATAILLIGFIITVSIRCTICKCGEVTIKN